MGDDLQIACFPLGMWQTNCYVVAVGQDCWIVDAGFEPGVLLEYVKEHGLRVEKIVLTHAHVDHIAGLAEVRDVPGKDGIAFVEFGDEMQATVAMNGLQGFKVTSDDHIRITYAKK